MTMDQLQDMLRAEQGVDERGSTHGGMRAAVDYSKSIELDPEEYFYQEQFAVGKNKSFIVDRRSFMVDDDDDDDDDF